jgi:hypothetical protein
MICGVNCGFISRVCVRSVVLGLAALLSACGGGGGGGGSGSGGGGSSDSRGIRVLHASIDASPVDLISSAASSTLISQVVFADSKGYRRAPSGAQTVSVTKAFSSSQVVQSFQVDLNPDDRYSILMYGDNQTFGVRTTLLRDEVPADISGVAVRIVNGVTGASAVSASISSGGQVAAQEQVSFGEASEYLLIPGAGDVVISAVRSADGRTAARSTVTLTQGGAYTFLVAGEVGYYSKGILFRDE